MGGFLFPCIKTCSVRSWRLCEGGENIGGGQIVLAVGTIDRPGGGRGRENIEFVWGGEARKMSSRVGRFIGVVTVEYLYCSSIEVDSVLQQSRKRRI